MILQALGAAQFLATMWAALQLVSASGLMADSPHNGLMEWRVGPYGVCVET